MHITDRSISPRDITSPWMLRTSHRSRVASVAALCAITGTAVAQSFTGLGSLPGGQFDANAFGVNADGSVVVGYSGNAAFRWTRTQGMVSLGLAPGWTAAVAAGVSDDGSVVVGYGGTSFQDVRAFRWTAAGGFVIIQPPLGATTTQGLGVSPDGSRVVGSSAFPANDRAFWWTASAGLQLLSAPIGVTGSAATAISADNAVIVGWQYQSGSQAFRWTTSSSMVPLGSDTAGAVAVNPDGSKVVGFGLVNGDQRPFIWSPSPGVAFLPPPPGGDLFWAVGASRDCRIVVGNGGPAGGPYTALIWREGAGTSELGAYLTTLGISTSGWSLSDATAVSADGLSLVGWGIHNGNPEPWIATLACFANCDGSTLTPTLNINDFVCFQTKFAAGDSYANCDNSTSAPVLNINDFVCFQQKFAAGCP